MRCLACTGEVGIHYDIPLIRESEFSEPYADPKVVADIGQHVFKAKEIIQSKYKGHIKIQAQLDALTGPDEFDESAIRALNSQSFLTESIKRIFQ